MAPLDSGALPPISDEQPAGENLELDPDFGAMERAAQGKPEVQYGNTIEAAVPPDWRETATIAESLLKRTHDLRVLVQLAIARLHTDGLPGFARMVLQIRQSLDAGWAHIHPQLDPEDDNDPMQRSNALTLLRDPARVLRALRDIPLAGNQRIGRVSWRDIAVMNGTMEPEGDKPKMSASEVMGIFRDSAPEQVAGTREALETLVAELPAISSVFDQHAGPGNGPDYENASDPRQQPLMRLLRDMLRQVTTYQQDVSEAPGEAAEAAPEGGPAEAAPAGGAGKAPGRAFASIIAITSLSKREEALHALELAANYFRSYEPSSPLPLLIDRAKRLAGMEFMEILRDLAPDGLSQAQLVAGATNE